MLEPGRPIDIPAAWTRDELTRDTSWVQPLASDEVAELEAAVEHVRRAGTKLLALSPQSFPLPKLSERLKAIAVELESGRGMVQLRGLPVEKLSMEDRRVMIWGLGTYLGVGLSQSMQGDFIGEVTDLAVDINDARGRAYRSKGLSRFHFDRCDVVGLLCIRRAASGGESRVVSSVAVHNEILRLRPDLLEVLYQDFFHSRQGEEALGEKPYFSVPLFSVHRGFFSAQLSFLYIESAQRLPDVPRLTERQREALELVRTVCDQLYVESPFLPGDLQLLNNHVTWHCRAAYEDHDDPERRRLLLRVWLSTPHSRPLPESYRDSWGATEPGALRGGVPSAEGWRDVAALAAQRNAAAERPSTLQPPG